MWHILSIGRDPMLLESRKLLLEGAGCAVVTATSLDAAASACKEQHFDAAVLCHTLTPEEFEAAKEELAACVPDLHIVRLQQYEDVGYDPLAFVHRVQQVASSI